MNFKDLECDSPCPRCGFNGVENKYFAHYEMWNPTDYLCRLCGQDYEGTEKEVAKEK